MGQPILIAGESGSGKSRSTKGLNPKETFIINVSGKELPYREAFKNYTEFHPSESPKGNHLIVSKADDIIKALLYVSNKRPEIKNIVIDDNQYISAFEFMNRAKQVGYDKFTDIALNMFNIVMTVKQQTRKDLKVFFLNHIEESMDVRGVKRIKAKTLGKLIDDKITYEGLFSIVLGTEVEEKNGKLSYYFITNSDGMTSFKSPEGMFEEMRIPNDLQVVVDAIENYYK